MEHRSHERDACTRALVLESRALLARLQTAGFDIDSSGREVLARSFRRAVRHSDSRQRPTSQRFFV
jgi:hypothetical protein